MKNKEERINKEKGRKIITNIKKT